MTLFEMASISQLLRAELILEEISPKTKIYMLQEMQMCSLEMYHIKTMIYNKETYHRTQ